MLRALRWAHLRANFLDPVARYWGFRHFYCDGHVYGIGFGAFHVCLAEF